MRRQARSTAWAVSLFACLAATSSQAGDLIWEVESPFRFFKASRSFALHEAAFNAARGDPSAPLPADIVWRTERALNDPDCKDASTPDRCAATAGKRYQQSRLGWAAQTLDETCYESNGRPRRYAARLRAQIFLGHGERRLRPAGGAHGRIRIAPEQLAGVSRRLHLDLAAAQGRRQDRNQELRLHGQAHHRARALFARSWQIRCLGHGQAARRSRAERTQRWWSRTSSSWRSAIRSPRVKAIPTGRCSSAPSARWSTIQPCCARNWRRERPPKTRRRASVLPPATIRPIRRCCRGG